MSQFDTTPQGTLSIESTSAVTPLQRWASEIEAAEKELETFHKRGDRVTRRYIDERDSIMASAKWFNVFYANTQIMESAIYAQIPKPLVTRKYIDYNDDVARVAALIIERCITQDLDDPSDTYDSTMRACVQDRLVPGIAIAWLRLITETEPLQVATELQGTPELPPDTAVAIKDRRIAIDYVYWKDILWSPCRIWEERRWTGRKAYT